MNGQAFSYYHAHLAHMRASIDDFGKQWYDPGTTPSMNSSSQCACRGRWFVSQGSHWHDSDGVCHTLTYCSPKAAH